MHDPARRVPLDQVLLHHDVDVVDVGPQAAASIVVHVVATDEKVVSPGELRAPALPLPVLVRLTLIKLVLGHEQFPRVKSMGLFGMSGASHDRGGGSIRTGVPPLVGVRTDLRVGFLHPPVCPPLEPCHVSARPSSDQRDETERPPWGALWGMEETHTHVRLHPD